MIRGGKENRPLNRHFVRTALLGGLVLLLSGCGRAIDLEDLSEAKQPLTNEIELKVDEDLAVPVFVEAGIDTGKGIDLYWEAAEGARGYEIQIGKDGSFTDAGEIFVEDPETLHVLAENLEEEVKYSFRIRSMGEGETRSEWSDLLTQTMYGAEVDQDLEPPFDFYYIMDAGDGICVQWKKPQRFTAFEVFRSYSGTEDWVRVAEDLEAGTPSRVQYDDTDYDESARTVCYMVRTILEEDGKRTVSAFDKILTAEYQEELELKESFLALPEGETFELTALHGWGRTKDLTWSSGNKKVARVSKKGLVKAVGKGKTVITAALPDGSQEVSIQVEIGREDPAPLKTYKEPFAYDEEAGIYRKKVQTENEAVILIAGDLMSMKGQLTGAWSQDRGYVFNDSFRYIKSLLRSADITAGNLETLVSALWPYNNEVSFVDGMPVCNTSPRYLDAVKDTGFDVLTMSNNHNCDWGVLAARETLANVDRYHFMHTGLYASEKDDRTLVVEAGGIKVGFLAYDGAGVGFNHKEETWSQEEIDTILNVYSRQRAKKDIKALRDKGADYIIACIHWGTANRATYNDKQAEAAKELADLGADYIAGSHPHLVQTFEMITASDGRQVPCIYSLGNFNTHLDSLEGQRNSVLMRLCLRREEDGRVVLAENNYIPCHTYTELEGASYAVVPMTKALCPEPDLEGREEILEAIGAAIGDQVQIYEP